MRVRVHAGAFGDIGEAGGRVDHLILVGTGDSLGVPRVYCTCDVCAEARLGGANHRLRCSAVLRAESGALWLDCGPDWRVQMEALGLRDPGVVLITHAHHDHIAGIPDLADRARWVKRPTRVLGPTDVLEEIVHRYPWVQKHLSFEPVEAGVNLLGYTIRASKVCHGHNGESHAYRFDRPGYAWAYCPDSIDLDEVQRAPLRRLNLLVLGTAYYEEDAATARRSLYDMTEAVALFDDLRPARAVFTHLSHGVDARTPYPLPDFVTVGHDGLDVPLV